MPCHAILFIYFWLAFWDFLVLWCFMMFYSGWHVGNQTICPKNPTANPPWRVVSTPQPDRHEHRCCRRRRSLANRAAARTPRPSGRTRPPTRPSSTVRTCRCKKHETRELPNEVLQVDESCQFYILWILIGCKTYRFFTTFFFRSVLLDPKGPRLKGHVIGDQNQLSACGVFRRLHQQLPSQHANVIAALRTLNPKLEKIKLGLQHHFAHMNCPVLYDSNFEVAALPIQKSVVPSKPHNLPQHLKQFHLLPIHDQLNGSHHLLGHRLHTALLPVPDRRSTAPAALGGTRHRCVGAGSDPFHGQGQVQHTSKRIEIYLWIGLVKFR